MTPFTDRELLALARDEATIYRGRVIPIMRGAAGDDEDAPDEGNKETPADKTFTPEQQAIVDRIVQERVARAKATPPPDYEDLKAAAAKLAEIEEANATELEKAQKRATEAEERATQALATVKETRLRSAILAEASKADRKVVDPESALALLDKSKLELDDDGNPTNIAEAMDALLEAKPFLVGGGTTARGGMNAADQGARGTDGVKQLASVEGMSAEEIAQAVAEGRYDAYLASKT